jgi:plastocyanin
MFSFVSGFAVLACCLFAIACSRHEARAPADTPGSAVSSAAPSASTGRITGKVKPPGSGIPIVVVLSPTVPRELPQQSELPVMDQVSLTFGPPLLFVRTNQPAEFRNSDDTLHNVHVTHEETREPQFNVAIPTGERYTYTFKREGFYHVGCDIHPAMSAAVFASISPHVTLAADDGTFAVEEVPPGEYGITVYAGATRTEREITVKAGDNNIAW